MMRRQADEHIVAAVRYIEKNISKAASVKGMPGEVKCGRRTLELAFRKHLGRTIHQEIVLAQVQKPMHLLVQSNCNLDGIAATCGIQTCAPSSRNIQD